MKLLAHISCTRDGTPLVYPSPPSTMPHGMVETPHVVDFSSLFLCSCIKNDRRYDCRTWPCQSLLAVCSTDVEACTVTYISRHVCTVYPVVQDMSLQAVIMLVAGVRTD